MTDIEKQDIIDSVVSFLKKDSLTIDQLVNTDVLNSEDMIELNKGRKASLEVLKDFIRGYGIYLEIIGKMMKHYLLTIMYFQLFVLYKKFYEILKN